MKHTSGVGWRVGQSNQAEPRGSMLVEETGGLGSYRTHPRTGHPGRRKNACTLLRASLGQPQNLLRDLKAVDSGWSACSGHRGPTGSMGDEKEGGEKITWWEKKGCIAYTIPASASQCFPRALHVVARFGK